MAQERDTYLDTMEDLVGHPGWRLLEKEFQIRIYQMQADALDEKVVSNWDQVNERRGAAKILAELIGLPELLKNLRDQQKESGE